MCAPPNKWMSASRPRYRDNGPGTLEGARPAPRYTLRRHSTGEGAVAPGSYFALGGVVFFAAGLRAGAFPAGAAGALLSGLAGFGAGFGAGAAFA